MSIGMWFRQYSVVDSDFDNDVIVSVRADAQSIGEMALDSNKRTTHYPSRAAAPSAPCPHLYVPIWVEEEREQARKDARKAHATMVKAGRDKAAARRKVVCDELVTRMHAETGVRAPDRVVAEGPEAIRVFYRMIARREFSDKQFASGFNESEERRRRS